MEEDLYNPKELFSNLQMSEVILGFPDHLLRCGVLKYGENSQITTAKRGCPLPLSHSHVFHTGAHFGLFDSLFSSLTPGGTKPELNIFSNNSESKWLTKGLMSCRGGKGRAWS